jgi:hypothetical protein
MEEYSIMDDSVNIDQDAASRFWDRYINILAEQGVKENIRRWYVKRVEQYIRHYPDVRLRSHSSRHIEQYFTDLGRDGRLADWQIRQTVDAIRILFCDLLHSEPFAEVDWEYWSEASTRLAPSHATLAREPVDAQISDSESSNFPSSDVQRRFPDALPRLVAEIRQLGYSIRTERSYEQWVLRFLAHHKHDSLDSITAAELILSFSLREKGPSVTQ